MQVYSLVGNPIGHSLSPPIHEAACEETGLDARYITFEPARNDIAAAVEGADALGILGLSVTIPFKQGVLEPVDPDLLAERTGAVNTTDSGGETLKGYNIDAVGITRPFERHGVSLAGNSAAIVDAGGAGRVAAFVLADAGASVHVVNRTAKTAVEFAATVPGATGGGLDTLDRIREADALVSATSAGMESPDETPVSAEYPHSDFAVPDAVCTPFETRLLRETVAAGAVTTDGVWILLLQGVEVLERWAGRDASVDAMNAAFRNHLESD